MLRIIAKQPGCTPGNSGQFVLQGALKDTQGVIFSRAVPGPGGVGGGLPQAFVPSPQTQINVLRVSSEPTESQVSESPDSFSVLRW